MRQDRTKSCLGYKKKVPLAVPLREEPAAHGRERGEQNRVGEHGEQDKVGEHGEQSKVGDTLVAVQSALAAPQDMQTEQPPVNRWVGEVGAVRILISWHFSRYVRSTRISFGLILLGFHSYGRLGSWDLKCIRCGGRCE
jgi:hypothetical protein